MLLVLKWVAKKDDVLQSVENPYDPDMILGPIEMT